MKKIVIELSNLVAKHKWSWNETKNYIVEYKKYDVLTLKDIDTAVALAKGDLTVVNL